MRTIPKLASCLLALTLFNAGCFLLVDPDEERLTPTVCLDAPVTPEILFPRPNSGVLGTTPIWGRATDCSGIDFVNIELVIDGEAQQVLEAEVEGDFFSVFWDTTEWDDRSPTLRAVARPNRPSIREQYSAPFEVTLFEFEPVMDASHGSGMMDSWAVIDLEGDGDNDLFWSQRLYERPRDGGFIEITVDAFQSFCEDPASGSACDEVGRPTYINAFADMNGDGELDAIVAECLEPTEVTRGCDEYGALLLAPGHTYTDVLGAHWETTSAVVINAAPPGHPGMPGSPRVVVADFDLDTHLDLFLVFECDYRDGCTVGPLNYLLMGRGTDSVLTDSWEYHEDPELRISEWDRTAQAADIIGDDGYPEIVIHRSLGTASVIFVNQGDGSPPTFVPLENPFPLPSNAPAQAVDYDGDGDFDLAFPHSDRGQAPSLWEQDGGQFHDVTGMVGYPGGVLADINNDGLLDAGAALGTPDHRFVDTGISAIGHPVDIRNEGFNLAVDFVRARDLISYSTLRGTGRIVVRWSRDQPPRGNTFGIGARVELWDGTDDILLATNMIGERWNGANPGFDAQFGADTDKEYRLRIRLPIEDAESRDVECDGVPGNAIVTIYERGGVVRCESD